MANNNANNVNNATYECEYCHYTFNDKANYYKHKRKKQACVSREQFQEIIEENKIKDSRLHYYEVKHEQMKEENEKLKLLIDRLTSKDDSIKTAIIETLEEEMKDLHEKVDKIDENIESSHSFNNNQLIINNNTQNNSLSLKIDLAVPRKERLDHLDHNTLLAILDHDDFNKTMSHMIQSVYFHPRCPENWNWCVIDEKAKYGALQFNHETGTLVKRATTAMIKESVENITFGVSDLLEELRMKRQFNMQQGINYNRFYGLVGTNELSMEAINSLKKVAHENRNFPRTLWSQLNYSIETTDINPKIRLKG